MVPTPAGDGSMYMIAGPEIVSVLIPIPEEPVENCDAVTIPETKILVAVKKPTVVIPEELMFVNVALVLMSVATVPIPL